MINTNILECLTCGERTTTRVAIGHGERQEFAFPCPKCGVEIRIGLNLDQEAVTFNYDLIKGANWITDGSPPLPTHTLSLDGESLVPRNLKQISPFMATAFLPRDPSLYDRERLLRLKVALTIWPKMEQLQVHRRMQNPSLFDRTARELGYKGPVRDWDERLKAEILIEREKLQCFRPFASVEENLVKQRIIHAEARAASQLPLIIQSLVDAHSNEKLNAEIYRVRKRFMKIYPAFAGLYQILYWDDTKHSINDFQLAEKRFDDLKTLYVDCFETLSRLSVIAATLEGVILFGSAVVPKRGGSMATIDFQTMSNGTKPSLLRRLPIADIFVPFMDNQLRNGVGHNSAGYEVQKDEIHYSNQNPSGVQDYQISYIRFCEKVVRIYRMLEVATLYADWLRAKVNGVPGSII